jgi:hypothetical protein
MARTDWTMRDYDALQEQAARDPRLSGLLFKLVAHIIEACASGPAHSVGVVTLGVADASAKLGMTRRELRSCVEILIACGYCVNVRKTWMGHGWGLRLVKAKGVAAVWAA